MATVGAFCSWYMFDKFAGIDLSGDGHSTVTFGQLRNWQECHSWEGFKANNYTAGGMSIEFDDPCEYFTVGVSRSLITNVIQAEDSAAEVAIAVGYM